MGDEGKFCSWDASLLDESESSNSSRVSAEIAGANKLLMRVSGKGTRVTGSSQLASGDRSGSENRRRSWSIVFEGEGVGVDGAEGSVLDGLGDWHEKGLRDVRDGRDESDDGDKAVGVVELVVHESKLAICDTRLGDRSKFGDCAWDNRDNENVFDGGGGFYRSVH